MVRKARALGHRAARPGDRQDRPGRRAPPDQRGDRGQRAQPLRHRHALQHDRHHRGRRPHPRPPPQAGADLGRKADLGPRRRLRLARARHQHRPAGRAGLRREHQHAGPLRAARAGRAGARGQLHLAAGGAARLRHGRSHQGPCGGPLLRGQGLHRGVLLDRLRGDHRGHGRHPSAIARAPGAAQQCLLGHPRAGRPRHRPAADRPGGHRLRRHRPLALHPAAPDARHHRPLQPFRHLRPARQPQAAAGRAVRRRHRPEQRRHRR